MEIEKLIKYCVEIKSNQNIMQEIKFNKVENEERCESSIINQYNSLCHCMKALVGYEKMTKTRKKLTNNARNYGKKSSIILYLSKNPTRIISMPEMRKVNRSKKKAKQRTRSSYVIPFIQNVSSSTKFAVSEHRLKCNSDRLNFTNQTNFKVYRCQVAPGVSEDCHKCCCSCNSDVLFEVMKDLYDCYKKRDCDNCNCILCCNLPEHKRSDMIKMMTPSLGLESALQELAMKGFALPEGKTDSEKNLIDKVRHNIGLPPEPKTDAMREKYINAANAGILLPLEKKTQDEKEKILKGLANVGIPLPEGRTPSEKALITKVKAGTGTPLPVITHSEKMRKAKSAGLLTPFEGKSPDNLEKILKGLAKQGILLPKGKTASRKKLINKVRADLGLPPEPKNSAMLDKHKKAAKIGLLVPLEGKSPAQKEKILHGLRNMGIPLPAGRTPSEKSLIAKVKAEHKMPPITSSEKLRAAKSAGLHTPLEGKTAAQKETILKDMAMKGIPLPTGRTESDKRLINKVRLNLGLPPEPKTPSMRDKHVKAAEAGILLPLEGKPTTEKERILRGLADMRIPFPKGRSPSEKLLINKVKLETREHLISPEKMRKARSAGLLTPFEGKTPEQKEKIFRGLAMHGIPLPEGKTISDKALLNKVRADLGLPPEPKTPVMKEKYIRAADAGLLLPLEGKTPKEKEKILDGYVKNGIPLPAGRTPSEKAIINKLKPRGTIKCLCEKLSPTITPEKIRQAKAAGLLTPIEGKLPKEKERILRNLAKAGLPLPSGKSPSDIELIKRIQKDLGIVEDTPEEKIRKAKAAGFLSPLENKTPEQRETILRGRAAAGLPLPEGTTPSEKDLIKRIKLSSGYVTPSPSERLEKAQAAGLMTPLIGKTPSTKERILKDMLAAGVPIPEGATPSEKEIVKKFLDLESDNIKKIKAAKAAGLITPLAGKKPEQQEKILRGLAKMNLPLPKPNTPSEAKLVIKIRFEMGLPPEPQSKSLRERYDRAYATGIITPLEGKSTEDKEKILLKMQTAGIPLPVGRTRSEKALIKRVKAGLSGSPKPPFDEMTTEEKEKMLRLLIKAGRPLPEGKTESTRRLVAKVRLHMGLPPEPKSESMKLKIRKAYSAGLITPLEGKNDLQKTKILTRLAKAGIPLPEGRTPSEKSEINKIQAKYKTRPRAPPSLPSSIVIKAKEQGLLTPLAGKSPEEKEKILRGLALVGIPFPEPTTASDKLLFVKMRLSLGLPPEPTTVSMKAKYQEAAAAGLLKPLEGLDDQDKETVLRGLFNLGIPLPQARTEDEKILIDKIISEANLAKKMPEGEVPEAITPLTGKTHSEKEIIIRGLADYGLPLPRGGTKSERALIRRIKKEYGIRSHEKSPSHKDMIRKAKEKGLFTPLTGKKPTEKERIVRGLAEAGLPLPEGKTATEKDIIKRVKADLNIMKSMSDQMKRKRTCDRACGCDTKKIKFKHSYVKISILSPDISNICPCSNECIPGVKPGIQAHTKGVNVVIERAIGVPQYSRRCFNNVPVHKETKSRHSITSDTAVKILYDNNKEYLCNGLYKQLNYGGTGPSSDSFSCIYHTLNAHTSISDNSDIESHHCDYVNAENYLLYKIPSHIQRFLSPHSIPSDIYEIASDYMIETDSFEDSLESLLFIKSETSLSLSSHCEVVNSGSIILYEDDDSTSDTVSYILDPPFQFNLNNDSIKNPNYHINGDYDATVDPIPRPSNELVNNSILNYAPENKLNCSSEKRDDDFQIFQMSQKNLSNVPENLRQTTVVTKNNERVVIINHLGSDIDVREVIDEILLNKEFCNVSSLIVIVPTSDDEDDQIKLKKPVDSSTCFQLSKKNYNWNSADEEDLSLPRKRPSKNVTGLKVSAKGKRFFLESVPAGAVIPSIKENECINDNLKDNEEVGTKPCPVNTPVAKAENNHFASTDTTQDRPCCCSKHKAESSDSTQSHKDRCIMNVVSEIITPMLSSQGGDSESKESAKQVIKGVLKTGSSNAPSTSVSMCQMSPCVVKKSCHFADDLPSKDSPEPLLEFKKLLEQQSPDTIKEICEQLRSRTLKSKQTQGTDCTGPRHHGDMAPVETHATCLSPPIHMPAYPMPPRQKTGCHIPPCHSPPDHMTPPSYMPPMQIPPGYIPQIQMPPMQNQLSYMPLGPGGKPVTVKETCPGCFKPKYKEGHEMQCSCSGKKKSIRLRPLCPCEQQQWPMSKILFGPKPGMRSVGCQCCVCDDAALVGPRGQIIPRLGQTAPKVLGTPVSIGLQNGPASIIVPKGHFMFGSKGQPKISQRIPMGFYGQPSLDREIAQLEICGPCGGYVHVDQGGMYTQAGLRQMRYSTGAGTDFGNVGVESSARMKKNCECSSSKKNKKKKNKVICTCPPQPQPEPEPGPEPITNLQFIPPKTGEPGRQSGIDWADLDMLTSEPNDYLEYYDDILKSRIETKRKKRLQMRSDLTQTTSGFKVDKKKKPRVNPDDESDTDVSVEEAIRYYALTKPNMLREMIPKEFLEQQQDTIILVPQEECVCEKVKSVNTEKTEKYANSEKSKVDCECPEEPLTEEQKAAIVANKIATKIATKKATKIPEDAARQRLLWDDTTISEPEVPEETVLKGFKIRLPGKGSGSKGLSGICCFDMMEQR